MHALIVITTLWNQDPGHYYCSKNIVGLQLNCWIMENKYSVNENAGIRR